jgi:hypothetical protein
MPNARRKRKAESNPKDWPVTFDQVKERQLLEGALLTTPEQRIALLEAMIEELREFLPDKRLQPIQTWAKPEGQKG